MPKSLRPLLVILWFGLISVAAGCQPQQTSTPDLPPPPATEIEDPTPTLSPSATATPSPTETALPTSTPRPTSIPIPWSGAELGPQNADFIEERYFWGVGAIQDVEYIEAFDVLIVRTANALYIYEAGSLKPIAVVPGEQTIALSEDNSILATTNAMPDFFSAAQSPVNTPEDIPGDAGEIRIWNPVDGSLLKTVRHAVEIPRYHDPDLDLVSYSGVH
ncbi:MAG: hypothetical protein R3335_00185, partial [Anaerolineales bacterium]|nr:hypothetical protein [Anaerolineales bacterium]